MWAIRQLRSVLAEVGGLALHRGRTMIHIEKLIMIVEQQAIQKAKARYCGVPGQAVTQLPSSLEVNQSAGLRDSDAQA